MSDLKLCAMCSRRAKGLCPKCGGEIGDKRFSRCWQCRKKNSEDRNRAIRIHKALGLCIRCSNTTQGKNGRCPKCKARHDAKCRADYARRKANR